MTRPGDHIAFWILIASAVQTIWQLPFWPSIFAALAVGWVYNERVKSDA